MNLKLFLVDDRSVSHCDHEDGHSIIIDAAYNAIIAHAVPPKLTQRPLKGFAQDTRILLGQDAICQKRPETSLYQNRKFFQLFSGVSFKRKVPHHIRGGVDLGREQSLPWNRFGSHLFERSRTLKGRQGNPLGLRGIVSKPYWRRTFWSGWWFWIKPQAFGPENHQYVQQPWLNLLSQSLNYYTCYIVIALMSTVSAHAERSFYEDHARGWHWYERIATEKSAKKEQKPQEDASSSLSSLESYEKRLKAYQKRVEGLKARAVMNPTPAHVRAYVEEQHRLIQRGETFGRVWQRVVYEHPHLDADVKDPKSQLMRHVVYEEERKEREKKLKALAKTHGLMFFFSTKCAFCHEIAPVVRLFAQTYGWDVLAVSMDGGKLPGFERIVNDNGTAETLGVRHFPTVLAVNPKTREVVPLAYGAQGMEEMTQRALVLTREEPDAAPLGEGTSP